MSVCLSLSLCSVVAVDPERDTKVCVAVLANKLQVCLCAIVCFFLFCCGSVCKVMCVVVYVLCCLLLFMTTAYFFFAIFFSW